MSHRWSIGRPKIPPKCGKSARTVWPTDKNPPNDQVRDMTLNVPLIPKIMPNYAQMHFCRLPIHTTQTSSAFAVHLPAVPGRYSTISNIRPKCHVLDGIRRAKLCRHLQAKPQATSGSFRVTYLTAAMLNSLEQVWSAANDQIRQTSATKLQNSTKKVSKFCQICLSQSHT